MQKNFRNFLTKYTYSIKNCIFPKIYKIIILRFLNLITKKIDCLTNLVKEHTNFAYWTSVCCPLIVMTHHQNNVRRTYNR